MEEEFESTVYNGQANIIVESSDSNNSNFQIHPSKRLKREHNNPVTKFKGLVPQQNGHWGAQIYCNHKRIWIGTFKSEKEAAMAYDSAAIKLRSGDCHRNLPWTKVSVKEPDFQRHFSTEAILNMIKDGSYPSKFYNYLNFSQSDEEKEMGFSRENFQEKNSNLFSRQLFQKELTPSDVGKLNRLVIPKKYAVKYFPRVSEIEEENVKNGFVGNLELSFYDKFMKLWKFRYCYWSSSQSFVFTRGWNRFVKEKELSAKDIVTFYTCECKEGDEKGKSICMIDVVYDSDRRNGGPVGVKNQCVGMEVELQLSLGLNDECDKSEDLQEKKSVSVEVNRDTKHGFRLFGVQICS